MTVKFDQQGESKIIVVLTAESTQEALLLAAWVGYDANVIHPTVERDVNNRILTVELRAE